MLCVENTKLNPAVREIGKISIASEIFAACTTGRSK